MKNTRIFRIFGAFTSRVALNSHPRAQSKKQVRGFTLLELLIVIAVIVVLAGILILVLNPAETLRRSRDAQRIADLNSLKTALGIYTTTVASPDLDAAVANHCLGTAPNTSALISYSVGITDVACTANVAEGADVTTGSTFSALADFCRYVTAANLTLTNGTGWVPVDLTAIPGGTPLSGLPTDPTNTVATTTAPANTDLVYRYACQNTAAAGFPATVFEFDAVLESSSNTTRMTTDGGDNDNYYESGTSVRLMGTGTNF